MRRCGHLLTALALFLSGRAFAVDGGTPDVAPDPGELRPPPAYETVVTGSRTEARLPSAVIPTEVITRREIEASGAKNLAELLAAHPGVESVGSYRGAGVRLQGLDPEYVLVLVDGERVTGRLGGWFDLSRFSLRQVERVEIVKGPASVLYGADALGGVIHLITRRATAPFEASARASFGSQDDLELRGEAGLLRGPLMLRLGLGHRGMQPFDLDPSDMITEGSGLVRLDVDGALEYQPSSSVRLFTQAGYLKHDKTGVDGAPSGALLRRRERAEELSVSTGTRLGFSGGRAAKLRAHHASSTYQLLQDQLGAKDLDQYSRSVDRLYELSGQLDVPLGAERTHQLTTGADFLHEQQTSDRLEGARRARSRVGLLLQDEWRVLAKPALTLSAGARVDLDSQFGPHPSPRLAALWAPWKDIAVRLSYGWGYRAPSFQELFLRYENTSVGYVVGGSPTLRPERSQGFGLAVDWAPAAALSFAANLFRNDVRDLISVVTLAPGEGDAPTRYSYANLARARTQGGELSARLRPLSAVYVDLGYGLVDAVDLNAGRRLEGRAMHRATAQLWGRHRRSGLEAMARAAWNGRRPFYVDLDADGAAETTTWAPPYLDVSLQALWRFHPNAQLFAGVTNLTNSFDPSFPARAPRGFHAGIFSHY